MKKERILWGLIFGTLIPTIIAKPSTLALTSPCQLSAQENAQLHQVLRTAQTPSSLSADLQYLTDRIGPRLPGTAAMDQALEWSKNRFLQFGLQNVHFESFTIAHGWKSKKIMLRLLSPKETHSQWHLAALGWSASTPITGLKKPLVDIGFGKTKTLTRLAKQIRGTILLVHSPIVDNGHEEKEHFEADETIEQWAERNGAAGILWMSTEPRGLLYRDPATADGSISRLPQAILAREEAMRLARLLKQEPIRVQLQIENKITGPIQQKNLVAELRGQRYPNEIVLLGAHLDSWDLGTGALDNGVNALLVQEVAHILKKSKIALQRTVRFVLFGGEEQGFLGSAAYVHTHLAELDHLRAALIIDEGSGKITGFSVEGRKELRPAVQQWLCPFQTWGINKEATRSDTEASGSTDNFDFLLEGVVNLVALQNAEGYYKDYHASSDTFDKVNLQHLKWNTTIMAAVVTRLQAQAAPLGKRLSRAEVLQFVERTGLKKEMQQERVWDAWRHGQRSPS